MAVLNTLLEITLYSTLIFCVTVLLKAVLKNRLSPALHYAIWGLFLLRLLMPFTIESSIHLITTSASPSTANQAFDFKDNNGMVRKSDMGQMPENSQPAVETSSDETNTFTTQYNPATASENTTDQQHTPFFINGILTYLPGIALAIWVTGIAISSIVLLYKYKKLRRKVAKCVLDKQNSAGTEANRLLRLLDSCKASICIRKNIEVSIQSGLDSPALLFPNIILLPDWLLHKEDSQLTMALTHELMHYKRKDHALSMLMLVLRCVYWFNPIMPLAARLIREDIETACDAMVIRHLPGQQKDYAQAILGMFSRQGHEAYMLGMALGNTKRIAEKRMRGVFMSKRSRRGAKTLTLCLASAMVVMCFTTACQPTPEKAAVVGKGDKAMQQAISQTPSGETDAQDATPRSNALYTRLSAPERWTETQEAFSGQMTLKADAVVDLPSACKVPVATAKGKKFTQQDVDTVAETIFGKEAKYYDMVHYTKEQVEQDLINARKQLNEFGDNLSEEDTFYKHKQQESIEWLESMLPTAPSESDLVPNSLILGQTLGENFQGEIYEGVYATTWVDDKQYILNICNDMYGYLTQMAITIESYYFGCVEIDEPYGVELTKEEAERQASELVGQLDGDMKLCSTYVGNTYTENYGSVWGWVCIFMREVEDFPSIYTTEDVGSDMESSLEKPIRYERIKVVINDSGLAEFRWNSPMEITAIETPDVEIIGFEEARDIAVKQLGILYESEDTFQDMPGGSIEVSQVELGLMRLAKQNSNEYYYAPVWSFFSRHKPSEDAQRQAAANGYPYKWEIAIEDVIDEKGNLIGGTTDGPYERWNSVTINAIDGSIVNKDLGY